jgi:hypothetical protein
MWRKDHFHQAVKNALEKDGWIITLQENNTDINVDEDLEGMGISKKEIVVGFRHPSMREYSDFAIA